MPNEVSIAFKGNVRSIGGSTGVSIPPEILESMGFNALKKYPVILKMFEGRHGKFIAIWADEERLEKLKNGETTQSEEE